MAPGVYGVEEIQPHDYYDGDDLLGSEDGTLKPPDSITGIRLISGTNATEYDFLELLPSQISGRVIADANGNGKIDPNEAPIPGVTVHLLDASGNRINNKTATTDKNGAYSFTRLAPGVYGVEEIQPDDYYDGDDLLGSEQGTLEPPDSITGIRLISGTMATEYDFLELEPVSFSGFVYIDDNQNVFRDKWEATIANVDLDLLDERGFPTGTTTTTDAYGYYRFGGLKPDEMYGVAEVQPDGFYDGSDSPGTEGGFALNPGDLITGIFLPPAANAEDYNFGELRPASISGRVHVEIDGDCTPDPGEPLLEGVTIYLLDAQGNRIRSTTTDQYGEYIFTNLEPGGYGVEEIQPEEYFDGKDHVGSAGGKLDGNDRIVGAKLGSGTDAVDYNFCEVMPAQISGYVFKDGPTIVLLPFEETPDLATVRDGKFTSDDTPIAGVQLKLVDSSGKLALGDDGQPITTSTNRHGYYEFTGLRPGSYTVLETQPEGYIDGIDTPGTNGGEAVNPHEQSDVSVLGLEGIDLNNDAIVGIALGPGEVARQNNFAEVMVRTLPPPPPPPPPPIPPEKPLLLPDPEPLRELFGIPEAEEPFGLGRVGTIATGLTWHLSVVNAGRPRRQSEDAFADGQSPYLNPVAWTTTEMDQSQWLIADDQGVPIKQLQFGREGAIPVTGDFDGDGTTEVAVFINGVWYIDLNGDGIWDEKDLWARLGQEGDVPITGDWDGDGKTDIGIFGPSWVGDARAIKAEPGLPDTDNHQTGSFKNVPPDEEDAAIGYRALRRTSNGDVRSDLIDHVFQFGREGDLPIAGDWNGDGVTNIGLFREGTWFLDADGNGQWSEGDVQVQRFGQAGDVPVVGDLNGDGVDEIGFYRNGAWRFDSDGDLAVSAHDEVFKLGGPKDMPVVGDFNGDGVDEIGIYRDGQAKPDGQAFRPEVPKDGVVRR